MKYSRPRSVARHFRRPVIYFFSLVAAQCIAPDFANQLITDAQSASSPAGLSKKQKLANPLNELLDEAQHDIDTNSFEAAIPPLQRARMLCR